MAVVMSECADMELIGMCERMPRSLNCCQTDIPDEAR